MQSRAGVRGLSLFRSLFTEPTPGTNKVMAPRLSHNEHTMASSHQTSKQASAPQPESLMRGISTQDARRRRRPQPSSGLLSSPRKQNPTLAHSRRLRNAACEEPCVALHVRRLTTGLMMWVWSLHSLAIFYRPEKKERKGEKRQNEFNSRACSSIHSLHWKLLKVETIYFNLFQLKRKQFNISLIWRKKRKKKT